MVAIVFEFSRVYFRAVLARLRALQSSLGALATTLPWFQARNHMCLDLEVVSVALKN